MNISELNKIVESLFIESKRGWEYESRIRYIWGNVLTLDGVPKFYINDSKEIVGEITFYQQNIKGFQGKMWYVNNIIVGFTRDSDNKYVVPAALGIPDTDSGYYIKGISESLKIIADEKRQAAAQRNELLNSILGLA